LERLLLTVTLLAVDCVHLVVVKKIIKAAKPKRWSWY